MSCEFYGRSAHSDPGAVEPKWMLATSGGNQCPVYTHRHAPYEMEMRGEAPDQTTCPLYKLGIGIFGAYKLVELVPPAKEPPGVRMWEPPDPTPRPKILDACREPVPYVKLVEFKVPPTDEENRLVWFLLKQLTRHHVDFQRHFHSGRETYYVLQTDLCTAQTIMSAWHELQQ